MSSGTVSCRSQVNCHKAAGARLITEKEIFIVDVRTIPETSLALALALTLSGSWCHLRTFLFIHCSDGRLAVMVDHGPCTGATRVQQHTADVGAICVDTVQELRTPAIRCTGLTVIFWLRR